MTRLQAEFQRLYCPAGSAALLDDQGRTRALVLELARPADWALLGRVWRGVQADLGLPAPAIAVSGEGLQLWFSLAEPVAAASAQAFLAPLQTRYLPDVARARLRLLPEDGAAPAPHHAAVLPALQASGNWSAFVAPDLVPLFDETPWLDLPPGDDGQAQLLAGLQSIPRPLFEATLAAASDVAAPAAAARLSPGEFLLAVMNDAQVALPLRIEAAKALLPFSRG